VFLFNHQSSIDPVLLMALLRRDVTAVAKKELAANPLVRLAGALADAVFIDRGNREDAVAAMRPLVEEALLRGKSLAVAPEGTRSGTGRLGPFKKGAFRLAMAGGVPVVPIVFRNANDVWPLGTQFMRPGTVDVVVHPPIPTAGWTDETLDAHIAAVRGVYLDTLANWPVQ
jgi:putative phosphoserine phosphatase/1-acylglycerol-3-phosphate O-acyltransferase